MFDFGVEVEAVPSADRGSLVRCVVCELVVDDVDVDAPIACRPCGDVAAVTPLLDFADGLFDSLLEVFFCFVCVRVKVKDYFVVEECSVGDVADPELVVVVEGVADGAFVAPLNVDFSVAALDGP